MSGRGKGGNRTISGGGNTGTTHKDPLYSVHDAAKFIQFMNQRFKGTIKRVY